MKTHNGVHTEFSRLSRGEPDIPADLRGFLQRTYELKAIADYGVGPGADVSRSEASDAMADAARLTAAVETALGRAAP